MFRIIEPAITSPLTSRTQYPPIPVATTPASREPIMKAPKNVPTMVPYPPAIDVPPIKTAAITGSRNPAPWVDQKFAISSVNSTPPKADIIPWSVKSFIFVRSTLIPTTRATCSLSPININASPKRCRFNRNQNRTASAIAHKLCAGTIPPTLPTRSTWSALPRMEMMFQESPWEDSVVKPFQKNCAARERE